MGFVFGVVTDREVLGSFAAILLAIGAYLFSKIEAWRPATLPLSAVENFIKSMGFHTVCLIFGHTSGTAAAESCPGWRV